jgi:hypothetical protein
MDSVVSLERRPIEMISVCHSSVVATYFSVRLESFLSCQPALHHSSNLLLDKLERQRIEVISVCHSALDAESKVETLFTCKRCVAENLFSAKSTLDLSATLRGFALDSVSSTE